MSISSPKGFYSAEEAAQKLGVHKESLLRAVRSGTCRLQAYEKPVPRARRKYFFKTADVRALKANK